MGDVDHNGRNDVAIVQGIDVGLVTVAHAKAHASFDATFSFSIGKQPTFVVSGDLDNDGVPDLLVATRDSSDVVALLSRLHPTGVADERSCSICADASAPGTTDSCQALP